MPFTPNKCTSKGGVGTNSNSDSKECVDPKEIGKSLNKISVVNMCKKGCSS